jgi:hypothetical protein
VKYRLTSRIEIVVLFVLSAVLLAWLSRDGLDARFQSPVSTVSPLVSPLMPSIVPGAVPVLPDATAPVPERDSGAAPRLFSATVWSSVLPWVAVGAAGFGGLAWALVRLLSYLDLDKPR